MANRKEEHLTFIIKAMEHPLVCYDGITGDLIKIQLRDGTRYSCTGVVDFLQPILDEYLADYTFINLLFCGDSGFATPELYHKCEENGIRHVIRLRENNNLREKAAYLVGELDDTTRENKVDYAVVYGEFMYQAASWSYERRVVFKVEKPENQMTYLYTFIVTNMDSFPEYLIRFYVNASIHVPVNTSEKFAITVIIQLHKLYYFNKLYNSYNYHKFFRRL